MKKILIITLITFILLLGQTYSKQEENINEQIFLIKLSNITNKNISLLDECLDKIITIYPEDNINTMKSYIFNYESIKNNTKNFEKQYLKEIYKISTTQYYNLKVKGIKINYIKAYTSTSKIKKCNNYLEKVEPL